MFTVRNEFGPVENFETLEEAEAFAKAENEADGEETHWVIGRPSLWMGETRLNDSGYPRG